jgi:competence protein ComEA
MALPALSSPAAASPAATASPPTSRGPASPDDPVFLNSAGIDDLRRLPGIGEKRATAILALRTRLGRLRAIEDLMKVKGIGRATLRRLRPLVRLDGPGDAGR